MVKHSVQPQKCARTKARGGSMKKQKQNQKHRWHLSDGEKKKIARLTRARVPQSTIARNLHIGRDTVSKWQRKMGLPTVPPVPEKQILKLLRKGYGQHRIHKMLRVSQPKVHAVMVKHGIRNGHATTPKENEDRFIAAVQRREDYIVRLAEKYQVAMCRAQRLAHQVLATPRFRPGASKPALSSDFPQRHFDVELARPDNYIQLVQRVLEKCFDGILPQVDVGAFVAAMMTAFAQTTLHGQPEPILDSFAAGLREAVITLRQSQTSWRN